MRDDSVDHAGKGNSRWKTRKDIQANNLAIYGDQPGWVATPKLQ